MPTENSHFESPAATPDGDPFEVVISLRQLATDDGRTQRHLDALGAELLDITTSDLPNTPQEMWEVIVRDDRAIITLRPGIPLSAARGYVTRGAEWVWLDHDEGLRSAGETCG